MARIWFSDEDRQRMRAVRAAQRESMERDLLFPEFFRVEHPEDVGTGHGATQELFDKIGRLDIRPRPDRPDEA